MADKRTWFKMDSSYILNPKIAGLVDESHAAVVLHLASIGYAAQHLTDGIVPVKLVCRIAGATAEDAVLLYAAGLWIDLGDGSAEIRDYLKHQRSAREVEGASSALSEAGRRGAAKRWGSDGQGYSQGHGVGHSQPYGVPDGVSDGVTDGLAIAEREEREEREEKKREGGDKPPTTTAKKGTRLPEDWMPDQTVREQMQTEFPHVDFRTEHAKFTDHWLAASGANATKKDWNAAWRNWIRRSVEFSQRSGKPTPAPDPRLAKDHVPDTCTRCTGLLHPTEVRAGHDRCENCRAAA